MVFLEKYTYFQESTQLIVTNKANLEHVRTIICVNPIISDFIVSEKQSLVFFWSDFAANVLNPSIGIYNLITGKKVVDINAN